MGVFKYLIVNEIYLFRPRAFGRLSESVGAFYQLLISADIAGGHEQQDRYGKGEKRTKAVIAGLEGRNTALPPIEKDIEQGQEDESDGDPQLLFPGLEVEDIDKNAGNDDNCDKQDQDAAGARADSTRAKCWHCFYLQRCNPVQSYLHIPKVEGKFKGQACGDGCQ